jgi:hypothetical protein
VWRSIRYAYVLGDPVNMTDPSGLLYENPNELSGCGGGPMHPAQQNPCGNPPPVKYPAYIPTQAPSYQEIGSVIDAVWDKLSLPERALAVLYFKVSGPTRRLIMATIQGLLRASGLVEASGYLGHWLDASGTPYQLPLDRVFTDTPGLANQVKKQAYVGYLAPKIALEVAKYSQQAGCFSFVIQPQTDNDWFTYKATEPPKGYSEQANWYYAVGDFAYTIGASVMVSSTGNGNATVTTAYKTFTYDVYDWNSGPGASAFDQLPGVVEETKLAQKYVITGESVQETTSYYYPSHSIPDYISPSGVVIP